MALSVTSSSQEPISRSSINELCDGRPIVVSYGSSEADWIEVREALKTVKGSDGVWDFTLGSNNSMHKSASGKRVFKIDARKDGLRGTPIGMRRQCQATLIDTVFHNYWLMKIGQDDFVPVIFNIDLSRTHDHRPIKKFGRVTLAEIEIVRKLCTDRRLPADFREMARKTVKFVRVEQLTYRKPGLLDPERTKMQKYFLTEVGAPWEDAGYAEHRRKVKEEFLADHPNFTTPAEKFDWYEQLEALLDPNAGFIPPSHINRTLAAS